MILKLVIHFIILVIWEVSAQGGLPVAKPGCDWRCGDVPIPFPFGMKSSECYAGKWFEIECRNTSTYTHYTPYLKSLGLEVTSIYLEAGTVTIKHPIYRSNCGSKDSPPVNQSLEGSPFVYSQQYNKFVAAGSNIIAILQLNGSEVSGCVSICEEDYKVGDIGKMDLRKSDCTGKSCCDSSLPLYLTEYSTEVKGLKENETSDECSYAMVVQQNLNYRRSNSYNAPKSYYFPVDGLVKDLDVVPAVLEWEILNNLNLTLPSDSLSYCYDTNVTSSRYKRSGQRCSCNTGKIVNREVPYGYGNPYVERGCPDPHLRPGPDIKPRISIIKGVSIIFFGSIILLLILWRVLKATKKAIVEKHRKRMFKRNGGLLLQQRFSSGEVNVDKVKLFSLKELKKATDNFNTNRVLGKGGQATVYKGMLINGTIIAVKKFKVQGKIEEFINEFVILSQINHRNVVKLLGSCLETEIPLLVYEFIPNGNLFEYLHQQNEDLPMTWDIRLRIATEVAGALFYLHSAASQPLSILTETCSDHKSIKKPA